MRCLLAPLQREATWLSLVRNTNEGNQKALKSVKRLEGLESCKRVEVDGAFILLILSGFYFNWLKDVFSSLFKLETVLNYTLWYDNLFYRAINYLIICAFCLKTGQPKSFLLWRKWSGIHFS